MDVVDVSDGAALAAHYDRQIELMMADDMAGFWKLTGTEPAEKTDRPMCHYTAWGMGSMITGQLFSRLGAEGTCSFCATQADQQWRRQHGVHSNAMIDLVQAGSAVRFEDFTDVADADETAFRFTREQLVEVKRRQLVSRGFDIDGRRVPLPDGTVIEGSR